MSRLLLAMVLLFGLTLLASVSTGAEDAPDETPNDPFPENFQAFTYKTMPYRLWIPKDYDPKTKYPIVLCLHGAHARGDSNRGAGSEAGAVLRTDEVQQKHPCFLLLPQCPKGKRWVDVPWRNGSYDSDKIPVTQELTTALDILDLVVKKYSIDPDRVYLAGQSMGGYGAWDSLVRRPHTFAAAIINCGAGDPNKANLMTDIPIWDFHGDQDKIVPVSGSREMVAAIQKAGGTHIQYTELPGAGHYPRIMHTPGLVDWLFAQKRRPPAASSDGDAAPR